MGRDSTFLFHAPVPPVVVLVTIISMALFTGAAVEAAVSLPATGAYDLGLVGASGPAGCMPMTLPEFYRPYLDDLLVRRNPERPPATFVSSTAANGGDCPNMDAECIRGTNICRRDVSLWGCDCAPVQCFEGDTCVCVKRAPVCLNVQSQLCPTSLGAFLPCT